jgi:hypothetical protein
MSPIILSAVFVAQANSLELLVNSRIDPSGCFLKL